MIKIVDLKRYEAMSNEYTIDKIKDYDYIKLRESNYEFISAINQLFECKKLWLRSIILLAILLSSPQVIKFYHMIYNPVRRAGVLKYNIGKGTIIICSILVILIIVYSILANRINYIIIDLEQRQKDLDFYLFIKEIEIFDKEVNARMLLFDKDDRINTCFDSNQKRIFNLFVLGVILLIIGILFIIAVLILALNVNVDNVKIISGFTTGVLIDFIGVIFIGMYNKTLESTLTLSNLINDNRKTNFSAYVASMISEEKIKNETLSKLAVSFFNNEKGKDDSSK